MPVKFICDRCGKVAPDENVFYESIEGWYSSCMTVLQMSRETEGGYSRRMLCYTWEYEKGKTFRGGCFYDTLKDENLKYSSGSFYEKIE